jgi:hypothetical protein
MMLDDTFRIDYKYGSKCEKIRALKHCSELSSLRC